MSHESRELDIEALIASSWKAGTGTSEKRGTGLSMSGVIEIADKETQDKLPPTVRNWLAVYDEVGAWFVNLLMLLISTAMNDARQLTSFQTSLACLTGNISAQIIAIRRLVTSGLDIQAKQLLRILTEQIDVAAALSLEPELAEELALTLEGDAANKFWHERVKRGRLRKLLFSRLEVTMGQRLAAELVEFIEQEEKILDAVVHPSMAAAQMACIPETGKPDGSFHVGFLGTTTIFSERTLSYAILYLTLYVTIGFAPDERSIDFARPAGQLIGPIQQHVLQGRTAALRLVASLIPNWYHPLLRCDFELTPQPVETAVPRP